MQQCTLHLFVFFFNDTATTEIYTLSLHDALPISRKPMLRPSPFRNLICPSNMRRLAQRFAPPSNACCLPSRDRKSTRLNSSHSQISYAVFCLKKKKNNVKAEVTQDRVEHDTERHS